MITVLHEDPYFRVEHNPSDALFRIARTARASADPGAIERAYEAVDHALASVPPGSRLLLDLREGPAHNDPALEAVVARARDRILPRFARVAILVRAAVRGAPASVAVFDDEDRAFDHLLA